MTRPAMGHLVARLGDLCRPMDRVQIMEVCGTHTVSLFRTGVKSLLPANLRLVSGPGCPVCVTPQGYIDAACELAGRDDVTIATYGDMVRVPGRDASLATMRSAGASVAVVYSARDALALARKDRGRTVVFLAVGFETTAPATAATILEARQGGVENFTILDGHKLVVPAMEALLSAGEVPIDGFLCPGHVSVIIGAEAYRPVVEKYHKPCVVAGFEAEAMVAAILAVVTQHAAGEARIENEYGPVVSGQGNAAARAMIERVFAPADASWRAMGTLPGSGLALREEFADFDACGRLGVEIGPDIPAAGCRCGEVIQGKVLPKDCPQFGKGCTPTRPIGPCMVSSEGACAAWFKYGS